MTALPADLEAALAAADATGSYLWASGPAVQTVKLTPGWADLPADARETLRRHRPAVHSLLLAYPRPRPDPVWFVRRNLAVFEVPASLCVGQRHVWRSGHCYHRLTPAVLAYLDAAVARRLPQLTPADRPELLARCGPLSDYVAAHYRPDQWDRAFVGQPVTLPEPPCPSPALA